jgi:hypothetical protein
LHSDLPLYTVSISSDSNTRKLSVYNIKKRATSPCLQHLTYKISVCLVPINIPGFKPLSVISANRKANSNFVRPSP